MRLEDVLPAYREGKKIKRKQWARVLCSQHEINDEDIMATDWEIIDNNKPITITREEFKRAWGSMPMEKAWGVDDLWEELKK